MTTQGNIHILISVQSLSLGNKLLCQPDLNLHIIFSTLASLPKFCYLFLIWISSVADFIYFPGFSRHVCLTTVIYICQLRSHPVLQPFPCLVPFSPYTEGLLWTQSAHIYKLIITVPACSAPLFSVLSSAFPRPAQEEKSTKRERLKRPFHYLM